MRRSSLTFDYLCSYKCNTLNAKEVILLMKTSRIVYSGNLRTEATHIRSGQTILTDAPLDNNGRGEAFSPTDLLATSLGNCMLTIMGIVSGRHNISIEGASVEITKIMAENPRRVAEIIVEFSMPSNNYTVQEKQLLENAALTCPVAKSLSADLKQTVVFSW
jgi:putative redox protein